MPETEQFDLIVIGAGPGGYVAAIRGAQLGMKVAIIEQRDQPGGVCLNEGCIPSKALLDSSELYSRAGSQFSQHGIEIPPPRLNLAAMLRRKDGIVKKLGDGISHLFNSHEIQRFIGTARIVAGEPDTPLQVLVETKGQLPLIDPGGVPLQDQEIALQQLQGARILLATGSEATPLPGIPFDGQVVVSAREALSFDTVPQHLIVAGGGYIGLELGSVWKRLGAQVTVMEMLPQILPTMDRQVADTLYRSLRKQGIQFKLGTRITAVRRIGAKAIVQYNAGTGSEEIDCDKVLVAVGRRPNSSESWYDQLGIVRDEKGRVVVNEDYRTSREGMYAIGDLISGPMLAHKASMEAIVCVERIKGQPSLVEYDSIPAVCYTHPEAASVGKTEEQLKAAGIPYIVGRSNYAASGRARCLDESEGFVKILAHATSDRILGVHIIGAHASDLIAEATTVISFGGTARDIALTCHAHPTLSELIREAALDIHHQAIHG